VPHEPLAVIFRLGSPVAVGPHPLTLDAILGAAAAEVRHGVGWADRHPTDLEWQDDLDLPLSMVGRRHVFYRASQAWFPRRRLLGAEGFVKTWSAGPDERWLGSGRRGGGSIDTHRGLFKGYQETVRSITAPHVVFFAHGDGRAVADLARRVAAIGRKREIGFGRVRECAVRRFPLDLALWYRGLPQRPIPVDEAAATPGAPSHVDAPVTMLAFRAPGWWSENQAFCYRPEWVI